jgi:protein-S-isoprenylcysteine O-methyltransferase Ste14
MEAAKMIKCQLIWWLFPASVLAFILLSLLLTRSGKLKSETVRKALIGAGAMLGFLTLALPLFEQPAFHSPLVQYGFGLPLLVLGLLGRIYPMIYLRKKGTTTTLDEVAKLVDSGPYAWVRHPQYTAGLVMLLGWFLAWGACYALGFMPLIAGLIYVQARIEEKFILEVLFGKAYAGYRERVGMLLPRLMRNRSLRITAAFLGFYAGLLAIQHGIFEVMQGSYPTGGLIFNAIGPPCQPEAVWHACFPAMSLIPNLLVTGITAMLVGLGLAVWAVAFVGRWRGGLVLGALSLLALLVGGGFVPVFIGMVAAVTASRLRLPASPGRRGWCIVSTLWPWPLVLMALWLPGSWLLGHFFGAAMLQAGILTFLVFDVSMPVLVAVSSFGCEKRLAG